MLSSLNLVDVSLIFAGILIIRTILKRFNQPALFPPGPRGLPIVGNMLDIPPSHEWLKFAEWEGKYGDILYLNLLGQPMIILNSSKHAVALLDKRSSIYSDRPVLVMGGEMVGWNRTLALSPYGERLREYRRFIAKFIGGHKQIDEYHDLEEYETVRFLERILKTPEHVHEHIRQTAGAIILKLVYGYEVKGVADPLVELVDTAVNQFSLASAPGAFLVDVFPLLRYVPSWLPGAGFQRTALEWRTYLEDTANIPFNLVKERMAEHTNSSNFVSDLLDTEKLEGEKEFNIKWSAASIYSGGADTTVSAVYSFFLAMTLFPEAQKRAQEEIDSVVGSDRLPSFNDRPNLPYIEALVKEVFRWAPVAPLGVPHRLLEDDVYEGYLIPKGSIVISNIWKMLHDPLVYVNPENFCPSRFLPQDEKEMPPDSRNFCFGFGRRICPGLRLADASVYISCAMTLAVFDITKVVENGCTIEPKAECTSGTISHPKPFKCSIKPRSTKAKALILSSKESYRL